MPAAGSTAGYLVGALWVAGLVVDGLVLVLVAASWLRTRAVTS